MPDDTHAWRFAQPGDRKTARAILDLHALLGKHGEVLSLGTKEAIEGEKGRLMRRQDFKTLGLVRAAAR